jgi:hypothetical protein
VWRGEGHICAGTGAEVRAATLALTARRLRQVNQLLLGSAGLDAKIHFYDVQALPNRHRRPHALVSSL